jgi:hypothetical protein
MQKFLSRRTAMTAMAAVGMVAVAFTATGTAQAKPLDSPPNPRPGYIIDCATTTDNLALVVSANGHSFNIMPSIDPTRRNCPWSQIDFPTASVEIFADNGQYVGSANYNRSQGLVIYEVDQLHYDAY